MRTIPLLEAGALSRDLVIALKQLDLIVLKGTMRTIRTGDEKTDFVDPIERRQKRGSYRSRGRRRSRTSAA